MESFPPNVNGQGATIVVPTVATGNVAQLAVDLFLHNLPPQTRVSRVARLEHPFLEPCLAVDPLRPADLSSELELYRVDLPTPLFVLQQRASTVRGHLKEFSRDLAAWVAAQSFSSVVVLSSLDARERADHALDDMRPKLVPVEGSALSVEALSASTRLPVYEDPPAGLVRPREERRTQPWALVNALRGFKAVAVACFATEGDNERDAELLASGLVSMLVSLESVKEAKELVRLGMAGGEGEATFWRFAQPESWLKGLYGDEDDYGYDIV